MSIDRINISNRGIDPSQALQGSESVNNAQKSRSTSKSDSLSLSSIAKDIDRFASTLEQSRVERFNRVREALEAGHYHVSGADIAQKLIDSNTK